MGSRAPPKRRAKPWRTTKPDSAARRRPDLVQRDFTTSRPDRLWVADLSYLRCWEGVVFFAFVIDAYSRRVVGWQLAAHMRTDLVLDALRWRSASAVPVPTSPRCITAIAAANPDSTGPRNSVSS